MQCDAATTASFRTELRLSLMRKVTTGALENRIKFNL